MEGFVIKSAISRKDSIILSAIEIIDKQGFQALSTKELAAQQGIVESALYRHFRSKDEIIVAALNYFSCFDTAIYDSAKQRDISAKEKITYYINSYVEYYENFPAITALLYSYEALQHNPGTKEIVQKTFNSRLMALTSLVAEGQASGELNERYCPEELAEIIMGLSRMVILKWRFNNYNFPLKRRVLSTLEKILSGC